MSRNTSFVGTLLVVAISEFNGIACVAQIDEVHSFDYTSFGYVEAGNDSFSDA